jgi:hypothetical protein
VKRKLPLKLKLTGQCVQMAGIKPGKKWSATDRKKVDACVLRKMRSK